MAKDLRLSTMLSSVLMLIIGAVLFIKPKTSIKIICLAIAAILFVIAITRLVVYIQVKKESSGRAMVNMVGAIIFVAVAILFLIRPTTIAQIIPIVLGLIIILDGIILLISGIIWHSFLPRKGLASILVGILSIILGYFAITYSFATQVLFMRFIGVALVIAALSNIVNQIMIERADAKKSDAKNVKFETIPNEASSSESTSEESSDDATSEQ